MRSEPSGVVAIWRNEWPTSMYGPPYTGSGRIEWETCGRPALSQEGRWLPLPEYAALLAITAEVESLRALNESRLSEPRSAEDVCEALCEASCVDVSHEKCAAIWDLMAGPSTTLFSLAVRAWERGESNRRLMDERAALTAEVAALRGLLGEARVAVEMASRGEWPVDPHERKKYDALLARINTMFGEN